MKIPLLYSPLHIAHAPAVEFDQGRLRPYAECPERIERMRARLLDSGLAEDGGGPLEVTLAELSGVHDPALLNFLARRAERLPDDSPYVYPEIFAIRPEMRRLARNPDWPDGAYAFDPYAPLGRATWQAALAAAGLALAGAERLQHGERCAYALCRPPGHHAGTDFYGGFCYLNNAALAVHRLLALGRVAVLDIDYHHGNGTQSLFWDEPRVLFVSLHGDPVFEYPYYSGFAEETGGPHAPNSNLNLPLPAGTDGATYLRALQRGLDAITAFDPAALVVSAGFDAGEGDPVGHFRLLPADYTAIGAAVGRLNRPTLFVQEGGYRLERLADCAEGLVRGFLEALRGTA